LAKVAAAAARPGKVGSTTLSFCLHSPGGRGEEKKNQEVIAVYRFRKYTPASEKKGY
jgi:hypothetical protein